MENDFLKAEAPRTFGSMWVTTPDAPLFGIPVHELIDGKWVETPEYKELQKKWQNST